MKTTEIINEITSEISDCRLSDFNAYMKGNAVENFRELLTSDTPLKLLLAILLLV